MFCNFVFCSQYWYGINRGKPDKLLYLNTKIKLKNNLLRPLLTYGRKERPQDITKEDCKENI
jgi:hypothetical protein